ncbi:MAG: hypothetical protein R2743_05085 [Ilumatobacteraceae bacterium]
MDPTHDPAGPSPSDHPSPSDERIDALARAAGAELRRPAPADGVARVRRQQRRRQAVIAGAAGTGVLAVVIGALVFTGGDDRSTVVPATEPTTGVSVPATTTPDETTPDETTPGETTPDETTPDESPNTTPVATDTPDTSATDTPPTDVPPNAAGDPDVVYVSDTFASFGSEVSTVDLRTGAVTSTSVIDEAAGEASRDAQDALMGRAVLPPTREVGHSSGLNAAGQDDVGYTTIEYDVGGITYSLDRLPPEVTSIDLFSAETLGRFDRCGQSELRVAGAPSALPERATALSISVDGRWMVVVGTDCPQPGTLADGRQLASDRSATLFDATQPDLPGRVLVDLALDGAGTTTFSADGRFVAVEAGDGLRFFATASAGELELVPDGCVASGTKWSRFIGPWIGESSVALQLRCGDVGHVLVADLDSGDSIDVEVGTVSDFGFVADVDFAHYDRPGNVWYTTCLLTPDTDRGTTGSCSVAQGNGEPVELPGALEASFLPLGFTYGG